MNISDKIKLMKNKELRSMFITKEQEQILTIIWKKQYIDNKTNLLLSNEYETSYYESEYSSLNMK